MTLSLPEPLSQKLGPDGILPQESLVRYAIDGLTPRAVLRPDNREGVSLIMAWAREAGVSVFPLGGGTQSALGNAPRSVDLVLDLSRLNRVLDYQPADLTVSVEAGVTLGRLQQVLAGGGKFLPIEAPLADAASIGGILATSATGPRSTSFGLPRDWLIGSEL